MKTSNNNFNLRGINNHEDNLNEFVYMNNGKEQVDIVKLTQHLIAEHHIIRVGERELMYFDGKRYRTLSTNDCKYIIKRHLPLHLRKSQTVNELHFQLITERQISLSLFNGDENIINFDNGILHLDTMEMTEHSPDVYSTIVIPCNYKSGMTLDDCPKFYKYLCELTNNNHELIRFIMQYIGAVISNVYGYRYKKLLILYGNGDTGKSVLRNLIIRIIGEENCHSIDIKQLNSRFGPAQIINKRLAGAGDMSVTKLDDIEIIKQITGGDDVNADRKGIDAVSFQYKGLLWFNTNKLPFFSGDKGKHVYDRFIIVPCNNVIPENIRNSNLVEELYEERDAIISAAVNALLQTIKNGYKFTECEAIAEMRKKYELANNSLKLFITEFCTIHEGKTVRSAFNRVYLNWCNANGLIPEHKSNIGSFLEQNYNIVARKTDGGNMTYDLTINISKLGQLGQSYQALDFPQTPYST